MNSKEAIEIIKEYKYKLEVSCSNQLDKDIEALDLAVKALEERPKGKWITWREAGNDIASDDRHECSYCHDPAQWLNGGFELLSDFCPNCGADMRSAQDLSYADNDTAQGGLASAT